MTRPALAVGLNAVIAAVTREVPRILTVGRADLQAGEGAGAVDSLPFGPLDPEGDRTLELGLRRYVRQQAGVELGYAEQLYTFGDRHRDPRELRGGPRVISVAYLALVREERLTGGGDARWRDVYRFLPWEDWRDGRPPVIDQEIAPVLERWVTEEESEPARRARAERSEIAFGRRGVAWDGYRVLDRYELLYEVGLVAEAWRDRRILGEERGEPAVPEDALPRLGLPMALDHRRILATALGRLRGKIRYRPVVFELVAPTFTLLQLQRTVEALAGVRLHKGNFRRLVEKGGLVEGTGRQDTSTGGRPAEIFRFRREVLRERPAPGVGLPGVRV